MAKRAPIAGVSVIILRGAAALLCRRAAPPLHREWTPPGGAMRWRETTTQAALRLVGEQTGIACELDGAFDALDWIVKGPLETQFVFTCIAARWIAREPAPGAGILEARFAPPDDWPDAVRPQVLDLLRAAATRASTRAPTDPIRPDLPRSAVASSETAVTAAARPLPD